MSTSRIKTSHKKGEVYPNVFSDFDWVAENRDALLEEYGTQIILVYEKQVVGTGKTVIEAAEDAERRLPPDIEEITPITYFLGHKYRIYQAI